MQQNSPPDIGQKIKQLRSDKNLTLDQLASMSGVSKSMLSQIERNKTNPTVGTLWSLTQALNVDISDLLNNTPAPKQEKQNISVIKDHQTPEIQSADSKCTLRILSPVSLASDFEWYDITIETEGILSSDPHTFGTKEHLTVYKGQITIRTGDEEKTLTEGDTARYNADVYHHIQNTGQSDAHLLLIVQSPR